MNYLHVAILEDTQECFVSTTEQGLRVQVTSALDKKSIPAFTDDEWADCVKGDLSCDRAADCAPFGTIYYYRSESQLVEKASGLGMSN